MSHPSIVTIYDAGKTDAFAYIAMERLHGQDLHEYLASGNRMSPRQAASMMMRLADAIHYANKRGLVHRDIKPSNIFLSRDLKPKLLDFGTALAPTPRDAKDKGTRQLVGTPNYMSPEQAKGEPLDARSDIFSLGTILYELLTGRRAFDGRTIDETLEQVLSAVRAPSTRSGPKRRSRWWPSCARRWSAIRRTDTRRPRTFAMHWPTSSTDRALRVPIFRQRRDRRTSHNRRPHASVSRPCSAERHCSRRSS